MSNLGSKSTSMAYLILAFLLMLSYYLAKFIGEAYYHNSDSYILLGVNFYANEITGSDVTYVLLYIAIGSAHLFSTNVRWAAVLHVLLITAAASFQIPLAFTQLCFWCKIYHTRSIDIASTTAMNNINNISNTSNLINITKTTIGNSSTTEAVNIATSCLRLAVCSVALVFSAICLHRWWNSTIVYVFGKRRKLHLFVCLIGMLGSFLYILPVLYIHFALGFGPDSCAYQKNNTNQVLQHIASDATYKFGPAFFNILITGLGAMGFIFELSDTGIKDLHSSLLFCVLFANFTLILLEQATKIAGYALTLNQGERTDCNSAAEIVGIASHSGVIACDLMASILLIIQLTV